MTKTFIEIMTDRCAFLEKTANSLENRKSSFPDGVLNIKTTKNGTYYYCHIGDNKKYLGRKDEDLIRQLVQKELITKAIKVSKKESSIILKVLHEYPDEVIEDLYDNLPGSRKKYATPFFLDTVQYAQQWLSIPYTPKSFKKDAPVFYTLKGERVRSKSEVIIADRLYAKGIPYKYECPLQVGDEIIHPDFTILRLSDRKIVYHEHCGKMDDPDYTEDLVSRVKKYGRAGIYPGNGLSFSFESSKQPLDISWLDDFIEKNFR